MRRLSNLINESAAEDKNLMLQMPHDTRVLIIDAMKNALKEELNAWYGYVIVSEFLRGINRCDVARFYKDTADDELRDHAFWLMKRINELGGTIEDISASPATWLTAKHTYVSPKWRDKYEGTKVVSNRDEMVVDVMDSLLENEANELGAIETYTHLQELTTGVDPVSNQKIKQILADEQSHLQEIQDFLADLVVLNK